MSKERNNFVGRCLNGEALSEDIFDEIQIWHESDSELELPAFLGLTQDEYFLWLERPNSLDLILHSKRTGRGLADVRTADNAHRIAARNLSEDNEAELVEWLIRTGRITD